ncbi:hypothetical protein FZ351_19290 [Salmonella enterica]|nr:hypothetical protein [Salmonella enterica]
MDSTISSNDHLPVIIIKIKEIKTFKGTFTIIPENEEQTEFEVRPEYIAKFAPKVGGYYVVYAGGYESYSEEDPTPPKVEIQ